MKFIRFDCSYWRNSRKLYRSSKEFGSKKRKSKTRRKSEATYVRSRPEVNTSFYFNNPTMKLPDCTNIFSPVSPSKMPKDSNYLSKSQDLKRNTCVGFIRLMLIPSKLKTLRSFLNVCLIVCTRNITKFFKDIAISIMNLFRLKNGSTQMRLAPLLQTINDPSTRTM